MTSRLRVLFLVLVVACSAAFGCGGPPAPRAPEGNGRALATLVAAAFKSEALEPPEAALQRWLLVVAEAKTGDSAWHVAALRAAVDSLTLRPVTALRDVTERSALAYRTSKIGGVDAEQVVERALVEAHEASTSPAVKGELARGLEAIAERRGDSKAAERYRGWRACPGALVLTGPVDWTSLSALGSPSPLDAFDAPMPATFTTPGPFGRTSAPAVVTERGCDIGLLVSSAEGGLREIVIDALIPRAQTITVELRARTAARLRIGGRDVLARAYELGDGPVTQMARVDVEEGRVRVVVRAAAIEHGSGIGLSLWNEKGEPLALVLPRAGDRAAAHAKRSEEIKTPEPQDSAERLTVALSALAAHDPRTAERLLAPAFKKDGTPELGLAYARSLDGAVDIPHIQRADRARGAVSKVLESWPTSWEASILSATLGAVRRGEGEATIEGLREIETRRAKGATSPMLDAFEASWASKADLHDRADAAIARFERTQRGTVLAAELRSFVSRVPPRERTNTECSGATLDRNTLDCYRSLRGLGEHEAAKRELARIRSLAGAPRLFASTAIRDALDAGDVASARSELAKTLPGERSIDALYSVESTANLPELRQRLSALLPIVRESPIPYAQLLTASGDDRLKPFDGVAERVVAADRAKRVMPEAATVVLSHTERYTVDEQGLVHGILHDVRRVGGTTDVEQNAQADAPNFLGRATMRAAIRRILKADGRILLPDQTPGAAQSHADLSQLGPGDAVEALYEGWALPNESFDIGFDTPDLLPDRTAVASATIEVSFPARLTPAMHVHPTLGQGAVKSEGGMRTFSWSLKDRPARRFEEGIPRMDRSVGVTLTTVTWHQVARALGETVRALDENDPEVADWARSTAHGAKAQREIVTAVVTAAGEALRQPAGALLADFGVGRAGARQTLSARTFLAEREGSRTWLIARSLRELGVPTEIVIAEHEPYSADPDFPARFGRFVHPLILARITSAGSSKTEDLWIDADVSGPPLPPGHFSPELRGRKILHADGRITAMPETEGMERDEVDLRLTLEKSGDARGSFTAVLRGRAAQELADAFTHIVGDERQRALRNVVLGFVPGANVDVVVLSSSEGSWQIALRADITVSGFAQQEKSRAGEVTWVVPGVDPIHYVFPRPFVTTVTSAYASQGARQNALAIGRAVQYHFHRAVELPAGTSVIRSPGPLRHDGTLLFAERSVAGGAKKLEDDFVLGVRTGTIARDDYGRFVEAARRIDEGFLASARLRF